MIQMISPDGDTKIKAREDKVAELERKGWRRADADPVIEQPEAEGEMTDGES
jgi:hypothetical protein